MYIAIVIAFTIGGLRSRSGSECVYRSRKNGVPPFSIWPLKFNGHHEIKMVDIKIINNDWHQNNWHARGLESWSKNSPDHETVKCIRFFVNFCSRSFCSCINNGSIHIVKMNIFLRKTAQKFLMQPNSLIKLIRAWAKVIWLLQLRRRKKVSWFHVSVFETA